MTKIEGDTFCDNCGVEITWSPVIETGIESSTGKFYKREYCCQDCFEGRPCNCGERMEMEEERRDLGGSAEDSDLGND
jgi:hypothetical protein